MFMEGKQSYLHNAVRSGSFTEVEALLRQGEDVNGLRDYWLNQETPLHCVIHKFILQLQNDINVSTFYKIAELLLAYGADINFRSADGITPLHYALLYAPITLVRLLLNNGHTSNEINVPIQLDCDILQQTKSVVVCLLNNIIDFEIIADDFLILLYFAARYGDEQSFEFILRRKPLIQVFINANVPSTYSPILHHVSRIGTRKMIELLLDYRVNINKFDENDETALYCSIRRGYHENVVCLLEHGASLDIVDCLGRTALHYVARYAINKEIAETIVSRADDVNVQNVMNEQTPLHVACRFSAYKNIKVFLQYGANVNAKDDNQITPLHEACCNAKSKVVLCLLEAGADINAVNKSGKTPLECSHNKNPFSTSVSILLAFLAKMKAENSFISEQNLKVLEARRDFQNYKHEIERMKKKKIVDSCYVSFFDFLTKDVHKLATYCSNRDIVDVLHSGYFIQDFPLYKDILINRIKEAKLQLLLIESAKKAAMVAFKESLKIKLPHFIVDMILENLENLDLKHLVEAVFKSA